MDAYRVFKEYVALKSYFNGSYDYFKYNGNTSSNTVKKWNSRKDGYYFQKILDKYGDKSLNYVFANILQDSSVYVISLASDMDCQHVYFDWNKRNRDLRATLENDMSNIDLWLDGKKPEDLVLTNGAMCAIMSLHVSGEISIESLVMLDSVTNFSAYILGDPLSDEILFKMKKLKPFLKYDDKYNKRIIDRVLLNT